MDLEDVFDGKNITTNMTSWKSRAIMIIPSAGVSPMNTGPT